MPSLPAFEAQFKAAFTSGSIAFAFGYKAVAIWSRAPFKSRVGIDINVLFELQVLLEDLLRSKLANVFSGVFGLASLISTFNSLDFSIVYIEFYVVCHAI